MFAFFLHIHEARKNITITNRFRYWSCGEFHIGQTGRKMITWLNDHNPVISTSNDTNGTKHLWQNPDHYIDLKKPIILSHASSWRKLKKKKHYTYLKKAAPTQY